jgi:uncharacterized Zn finger protein (UPF0148 family)
MLLCPQCGTSYFEKETAIQDQVKSKHDPTSNQTKIISGKSQKKKYYDKQGNEITDPELIQDMIRGLTVISYREEKSSTRIVDNLNR